MHLMIATYITWIDELSPHRRRRRRRQQHLLFGLLFPIYFSIETSFGDEETAAAGGDEEAHGPRDEQGDSQDANAQAGRPMSAVEEHWENADGDERASRALDAEQRPAMAVELRRRVGAEDAAAVDVLHSSRLYLVFVIRAGEEGEAMQST